VAGFTLADEKDFPYLLDCDRKQAMKKQILRLALALAGITFLVGCATDSGDSGTSQGISAQPTPGSSRLGIQEGQSKVIRRLSY
jgi:hypothetical protein